MKIIDEILRMFGLKSKQLDRDSQWYNTRLFSATLNNNDSIIYSTPKLKLQGFSIRGNPDGSEDLVRLTADGNFAFVEKLCGPGKGKFDYLITKRSKEGRYDYLETQKELEGE